MNFALTNASLHELALDGEAERQAIECLLNCYLREYALPRKEATLDSRAQDIPMSFRQQQTQCVSIQLPSGKVVVQVDHASELGRCHFVSAPYFKGNGQTWQPLAANQLARLLCVPLSSPQRVSELLQQVDNSLQITRTFLRHTPLTNTRPSDTLLNSEQHQIWGHALHPTPKSREGISRQALLECSPEVGARFALHWFRVDPRLIRHQGEDPRPTLRKLCGGRDDLYPCHPWEVQRILADPLVLRAQQQGLLEYVGAQGLAVYPTSSVRTLYHPELPYFLKFSMHVRLTNCIRKNAWYELDSAVALTRLLTPVMSELARTLPDFLLMPEPAATTLDLSALGTLEQAREVTECFGIIYRRNIDETTRQHYQPQVAMALFTWDLQGRSVCTSAVKRCAEKLGKDLAAATLHWLDGYARQLLGGVMHCLFRQGVVLEPHLQNTIIGFDQDGVPCRVWIRDLEGTKLVASHWPIERLGELPERTRASLYYDQQQAWQRVAYCTLVNNLGEAIFHLAGANSALECRLWAHIHSLLQSQTTLLDNPVQLTELCAGAPLPSKENFMTRLMMRADREAGYTALPNPLTEIARVSA